MQKQARQLNIESNSQRFLDAVKCFWMPRLLQKMEQSSSPTFNSSLTSMNSQSSSAHLSPNPTVPLSPSSPPPIKIDNSNYPNQNLSSLTSTTIHSSDSMKVTEQPQVPEHPAGPFQAFGNTHHYNHPNLIDSWSVDSRTYDMEAMALETMSAMGTNENSLLDCHMAGGDWLCDNMVDSLWNMTEM